MNPVPTKKSTQGWREIGGQRKYFRSKWEANYARYLEFLKGHGEITGWSHEPRTFWFKEILRGVRSYLPDFEVVNKNFSVEYHEVKGYLDARSKTKHSRMKKYYPNVTLRIIDHKWFKNNNKMCRAVIKDWE